MKELEEFVVHKVKTHMKTDIENLSRDRLLKLAESDSNFWDLWMSEYCSWDSSCDYENELLGGSSAASSQPWFPLRSLTFKTLSLHTRGSLVQVGQAVSELIQERYIEIQKEMHAKAREQEAQIERVRKAQENEAQKRQDEIDQHVKGVQGQIKLDLEADFSTAIYRLNSGTSYTIDTDFQQKALAQFVQDWALQRLGLQIDQEQALAASEVSSHSKVNARAGSGKTTVMCVRAALLMDLCSVRPEEIMMLAFNRSAAKELEDRMNRYLTALSKPRLEKLVSDDSRVRPIVISELADGTSFQTPWIMTFDALARAIVEGSEGTLHSRSFIDNADKKITEIILDLISVPSYRQEFKDVMLANFKDDWNDLIELEVGLSSAEKELLSKSLPRETFRGERVRSSGEKAIADYLFGLGLPYIYEKNIRIGARKYKPDFALESGSRTLFIEYAGLLHDENYERVFREKTEAMAKAHQEFLVLVPWQIADDSFKEAILGFLRENEFELPENPTSPEDYWDEYLEAKFKRRFIAAVKSFVDRIRQSQLDPSELYSQGLARLAREDLVAFRFSKLAWQVYEKYMDELVSQNAEDYKAVLHRAITALAAGQKVAKRKGSDIDLSRLKYFSLDEYQDFSELYGSLVTNLQKINRESKICAVGDHWQSINAFMGASPALFAEFEHRWPGVRNRNITFNYRSSREIVEVGNRLMQQVEGAPSKVGLETSGQVWLMDYDDLVQSPSEVSTKLGNEEIAIIRILIKILLKDPESSVALLSRKNSISWWYPGKNTNSFDSDLQDYLNLILSHVDTQYHSRISIQTVHSFKGLEADNVVLLDALDVSFPLIHSDWRFSKLFGESLSRIVSEERRVFYVAITRAKKNLYILTRSSRPSGFLGHLGVKTSTWALFPPIAKGVRLICSGKGTFEIKDELQKAGFAWHALNKEWFLDVSEFMEGKSFTDILKALRASKHEWVRVVQSSAEASTFIDLEGERNKVSW